MYLLTWPGIPIKCYLKRIDEVCSLYNYRYLYWLRWFRKRFNFVSRIYSAGETKFTAADLTQSVQIYYCLYCMCVYNSSVASGFEITCKHRFTTKALVCKLHMFFPFSVKERQYIWKRQCSSRWPILYRSQVSGNRNIFWEKLAIVLRRCVPYQIPTHIMCNMVHK